MADQRRTAVLYIDGKSYVVTGTNSQESFRSIEKMLNERIRKVKTLPTLHPTGSERQLMLAAINLASDYMDLEKKLDEKEKEAQKALEKAGQAEKEAKEAREALKAMEAVKAKEAPKDSASTVSARGARPASASSADQKRLKKLQSQVDSYEKQLLDPESENQELARKLEEMQKKQTRP